MYKTQHHSKAHIDQCFEQLVEMLQEGLQLGESAMPLSHSPLYQAHEWGILPILKQCEVGGSIAENPRNNLSRTLMLKVEIPIFESHNLRTWIRCCLKYFQVFHIADENKVETIVLYLGDKAEIWFHR